MSVFGYGNFDIVTDDNPTKKEVEEMIAENNAKVIKPEIERVEWLTDDVHVLPSRIDFPGKPGDAVPLDDNDDIIVAYPTEKPAEGTVKEDDIYQAGDTGVQYIWVVDNSIFGGYYKVVSETKRIKSDEIHNLFI